MLPAAFILSHRPKRYLKQGLTNCGLYAAEGILSAYGRNPSEKSPSEFHESAIQRALGLTPVPLIVRVLQKHGLRSQIGNARDWSNEKRLTFLKETLSKDTPIVIRIGGGYSGNGIYKPILGRIIGHWITLWGYDDEKEVFYVYDSAIDPQFHQPLYGLNLKYEIFLLVPTCL